jgi:alkylation response protein AidB-like acyl-CoA dehydrogenase
MVEYKLSEQQLGLQKSAKDFAETELKPVAQEFDRKTNPRECFPSEVYAKSVERGFQGIYVPQEFGGLGLGDFEAALVFEEIGAADAGFGSALCISAAISQGIIHFGTKDQKESWLPKIARKGDFVLGFGVTEYGAGSEAYVANADPKVGLQTTSRLEGKDYIVNGRKHFISNGGVGKLYGLATRSTMDRPMFETITIFMVDEATPGFRIGKIEDKMGQRLMLNGELIFENARVPLENRLGEEKQGAGVMVDVACSTTVTIGATMVGLARAAYEAAHQYALKRISGGQPLINHEAISLLLADMKIGIESARALLWQVAWMNDNVRRDYPQSAMVKVYCAEVAKMATNHALQIHGGFGYMRDSGPIEKYVRDATVATIYDGTGEVLKQWISGSQHF